jgi:hypothetical protein
MYINDLSGAIKHGKPFYFADDVKIVYSFQLIDLLLTIQNIQQDLTGADTWCKIWLMKFSANKSNIIAHRCQIPINSITLDGHNIPITKSVRDLGIRYSNTFNFSEQVNYQAARTRQTMGRIKNAFSLPAARIELYKICVRPQLEYCSFIYGNLRKSDRLILERLQRSFSKSIVGYSSSLTYKERCQKLKIDPLWLRRMKLNLALLYNLTHGHAFSTHFAVHLQHSSPHGLRNKGFTLTNLRARKKIRANFFMVKYSYIWNKLPPAVRASSNINRFKKELDKYLTLQNVMFILEISSSEDDLFENGPNNI